MRLLFCSELSGDDRGGGSGSGFPVAAAFTMAKNGDERNNRAAVWASIIPGGWCMDIALEWGGNIPIGPMTLPIEGENPE